MIHGLTPHANPATHFRATLGLRGSLPTAEFDAADKPKFDAFLAAVESMFSTATSQAEPVSYPPRRLGGKRFTGRCSYCLIASDELERDHIVPFSKGGGEEPDNLTPICRSCNARKRDKSLLQFLGEEAPEYRVRPEMEVTG